ncbi:MAG: fucose isomerase [Gemmatimonadales bacterium]|nr:fucose isomerase [Gemmatimonadales bacterium]
MSNVPVVRPGIVAVSRDCFPIELSRRRRRAVVEACHATDLEVTEIETIVEHERDVLTALEELENAGVNALVVYLGNFGPEGPSTLLAQRFPGPVMVAAGAEESGEDLVNGRGDAYCGLLSASYNLGLRSLRPHIPEYPVGLAGEVAGMIAEFVPVARVVLGLRQLKIFTFGPRPWDFFACNAPIKPLFDLGVEIMENSELDLLEVYRGAAAHSDVARVAADMARELGGGNRYPDLLTGLAQLEVGLLGFMEQHLGASRYAAFANKCWPAFEPNFGFVPCFINSRLATRGIPVACEADIYGALSEYLAACATRLPVTLLDINNTVPADLAASAAAHTEGYRPTDLFMGFHCGNTPGGCLVGGEMRHQLIMHRLMEPGQEPNITRGTLEGRIRPGEATILRLQATAEGALKAYVAEGEVLDMPTRTFGGTGVLAIREMGRFYRHVLIEQRFPHHAAVAFQHAGRTLFAALRMLGVEEIFWNRPAGMPYRTENPF